MERFEQLVEKWLETQKFMLLCVVCLLVLIAGMVTLTYVIAGQPIPLPWGAQAYFVLVKEIAGLP